MYLIIADPPHEATTGVLLTSFEARIAGQSSILTNNTRVRTLSKRHHLHYEAYYVSISANIISKLFMTGPPPRMLAAQ